MQSTRSNDGAVKGLCKQVEDLCEVIKQVADTVQKAVNRIPGDSRDRGDVEWKLRASKESATLNARIDKLERCVSVSS